MKKSTKKLKSFGEFLEEDYFRKGKENRKSGSEGSNNNDHY